MYRFTRLEGNRQYLYKMEKSEKEKKVVLEKKLAFFSFSPLKAAKFFWSYVLQESVAVNFDVPSSVVRA